MLTLSNFSQGLDRGVHGYWSIEVNTRECPRTIWDRVSKSNFCLTASNLSNYQLVEKYLQVTAMDAPVDMKRNPCCIGVIIETVVCYPCVSLWYTMYHSTPLLFLECKPSSPYPAIKLPSVYYWARASRYMGALSHEYSCLVQVIADA
jgi:hypothetical protein